MGIDTVFCLNGCQLRVHVRGLCKKCYELAHYRVRRGQTTWAQLISLGKARHAQSRAEIAAKSRRYYKGFGNAG